MKTHAVDLHLLHKKESQRSHSLYVEDSRFAETQDNPGCDAAQPRRKENAACGKEFARSR